MKNKKLIIFSILTGFLSFHAFGGAKNCLTRPYLCDRISTDIPYSTVSMSCVTSDSRDVTYELLAMCASQNTGSPAEVLTLDGSNPSANNHCWCRMIEPAVSKWRSAKSYTDYVECVNNCISHCASRYKTSRNINQFFTNIL